MTKLLACGRVFSLDYFIYRQPAGHLCGYVTVPADHPWSGKDYSDLVQVPEEILFREFSADEVGPLAIFGFEDPTTEACPIVLAISTHGGITFAGTISDSPLWAFGFDCAHSWDSPHPESPRYRNLSYVTEKCVSLAEQLSAVPNWHPKELL